MASIKHSRTFSHYDQTDLFVLVLRPKCLQNYKFFQSTKIKLWFAFKIDLCTFFEEIYDPHIIFNEYHF